MKSKKHWILNLLYINPDDKRMIVQYPFKLGYSFNFGNPKAIRAFSWTILLVLISLVAIPAVYHYQYIINYPSIFLWILLSCISALFILFVNTSENSLIWEKLPNFSFGFLAVGIGFGGQSIINGLLFYLIGAENIVWVHHLIFGPVAAICQTLGKILIILFIVKIFNTLNVKTYIVYALIIGFGFTIGEIFYIGSQIVISEQIITGYLGVWERSISSLFHIYSAGLIAISLYNKKYSLILLVVFTHAVTDIIAGSSNSMQISIITLELIFSAFSLIIWVAYLIKMKNIELLTNEI